MQTKFARYKLSTYLCSRTTNRHKTTIMKRFLSLAAYALLTATMTFSLAACGGSDDDEDKDGGAKETMTKEQVRSILLSKKEWTVETGEDTRYLFAFEENSVMKAIYAGAFNMQTYESWDITPKKGDNYAEGSVVCEESTLLFHYRNMKESGFQVSLDGGKSWYDAKVDFKNEIFTVGGVSFTMVAVEGDTYLMGIPSLYAYSHLPYNEKPQHEETVGDFYIGQTEVTQALWKAVMSNSMGEFKGDKQPVEQVSYNHCMTFIAQLNKMTGKKFRLPTEEEWEYAAKGGKKSHKKENTTYACGQYSLDWTAWYVDNSGNMPHEVGTTKYGNELNLRDMSGNVWEWTSSHASENYEAPRDHNYYTVRGGSWKSFASSCRVTTRMGKKPDYLANDLGFRLALDK